MAATREELMAALRNADAAKDADGAKRIAAMINDLDQTSSGSTSQAFSMTQDEARALPEMGALENKLLLENILPGGEPYDFNNIGSSFKMALGNLVSSDPAQQIEIIQNSLPEANIRTLPTGETVVNYQDENFIMNKPGISSSDITRLVGQFLAFLPLGKVAQISRTGAANMGAGATAQRGAQVVAGATTAAGTSVGLDVAAGQVADKTLEETEISGERAVVSGLFGGAAELVGPAFRAAYDKFKGTPDDLKYIDLDSVKQFREAAENTGIEILEPQATGARADFGAMEVLQELPQTQQQMAQVLKKQNAQAHEAVVRYLNIIGPKNALETAPQKVRDMAIKAIDDMKAARSDLVTKGYQEAFEAGTKVDVQPTISAIDDMLLKTSSSDKNPVRMALVKYKDLISADSVEGLTDLEILDGVKRSLDDAIEGFGESAVDKTTKAKLKDVRSILRGEMEDASPLYDEVKDIFKEASGPIDDMQASLIGKISGIKDDNLKRLLPSIFDASESNPAILKRVKSIIEAKDPDAWNALLRAHLESNMGKISTRAVEGTQNIPAMMRDAIFGKNEIQRKMILDSMTGEQKGTARWLEVALKGAARGRRVGSPTAGRQETIAQMKDNPLVAWMNPLAWAKNLTAAAKQSRFEKRSAALADAISNPKWSEEMLKLKKLSPTDSGAARSLVQMLTRIVAGDE